MRKIRVKKRFQSHFVLKRVNESMPNAPRSWNDLFHQLENSRWTVRKKVIIRVKMIPMKIEDRKGPNAVNGPVCQNFEPLKGGNPTQIWSNISSIIKIVSLLNKKNYTWTVWENPTPESSSMSRPLQHELIQLTYRNPDRQLSLPRGVIRSIFGKFVTLSDSGIVYYRFCRRILQIHFLVYDTT